MFFCLLHDGGELVEQVVTVLRAGGRLRAELDAEHVGALGGNTGDGVVREIDIGGAEAGTGEAVGIDGPDVVLRRHDDLAGGGVLDRVAAMVAELELGHLRAAGHGDQLAAQRNAEDGQLAAQGTDQLDDLRNILGRAGAAGNDYAVGMGVQHLLGGGIPRQDGHVAAAGIEGADDAQLDAAVDGDHVEAVVRGAGIPLLAAADLRDEVVRDGRGRNAGQRLLLRRAGVGDDDAAAAAVADAAGQRAGVNARDAGDVALLENLGESLGVAEVAGKVVVLADDEAADAQNAGLKVVIGDAVVADEGIGHNNHLASVGGVGDDLLIAHHRIVEDDLADALTAVAEAVAVILGATLKHDLAVIGF